MNILIAQTNFYNQTISAGYQILLVFSTQLLGYGIAGLSRRFLVWPAEMIWPETLVTTTLFDTLGSKKFDKSLADGWSISRYRFFVYVAVFSFSFYWLPGYLFKALSYFNFICWIFPKNIVVNQLFGVNSGLGLVPITFDWTQITQAATNNVSPLATPAWVAANTYAAVFIFFIVVLPCLYYNNEFYSKFMPMISTTTYDNTQNKYNVTRVLTKDLVFDEAGYQKYSPLFVPFSYLLSYALNFAGVTAIFTHCYLYHGKDIARKLKNATHGGEDIHKRLMNNFKDVPDWWYLSLFAISIGLSFAAVCAFDTQLPAWGLVIALAIAFVTFIPQGLLEGITNQHVGLNIITELIAGYIFPGKPIANMMVKLYGFIPMRQGLDFARDLKLAQYMKIPPRLLFWIQIWGTLIAGLINVGIQEWMRSNIKEVCSSMQPDGFTCANGRTIFNASIIWGAVGPGKLFSPGKRYHCFMWFFLIGFGTPFITYVLKKRYPTKWFAKINAPVFFTGASNIPPSTVYNYSLYFIACFGFNHYIKDKWTRFHSKYTYVLSAGIDSGVAMAVVIIFLCVSYPAGSLKWWGNTVYTNTKDYQYAKFYTLPKGETF
ncbi:OPT superfamily oligopeptide transporter, partial [Nadsonia fulvescens var. elongata DSM 6958]